jgi:hypothetical protein
VRDGESRPRREWANSDIPFEGLETHRHPSIPGVFILTGSPANGQPDGVSAGASEPCRSACPAPSRKRQFKEAALIEIVRPRGAYYQIIGKGRTYLVGGLDAEEIDVEDV